MAMEATGVHIEGWEELRRKFRDLGDRMQKNVVRGALRSAATPVLKEAHALAPKDEHDLANAIAMTVSVKKNESSAAVGIKRRQEGAPARYAHLQEFGTRHHRAQPFLRPALDNKRGDVIDRFADAVKSQIKRLALKAGIG